MLLLGTEALDRCKFVLFGILEWNFLFYIKTVNFNDPISLGQVRSLPSLTSPLLLKNWFSDQDSLAIRYIFMVSGTLITVEWITWNPFKDVENESNSSGSHYERYKLNELKWRFIIFYEMMFIDVRTIEFYCITCELNKICLKWGYTISWLDWDDIKQSNDLRV